MANIFDQFDTPEDAPKANPFDQFDEPAPPTRKERREARAANYQSKLPLSAQAGLAPKPDRMPLRDAIAGQAKHSLEKMIYGGVLPMINSTGEVGGALTPWGNPEDGSPAYDHKNALNDGAAFVETAREQGMPNIAGAAVEAIPQIAAAVGSGGSSVAARMLAQSLASAATTPGGNKERGTAAALAAAGELGGTALTEGIKRIVKPINPTAQAQTLINNGIYPTWGGSAGPAFKTAEDKVMSIPLLGDFTAAGRRGGINEYNAWAMSRSGVPINRSQVGSEGHQIIGDHFRAQYPEVMRDLRMNPNDPLFTQTLNDILRNRRVNADGVAEMNSLVNGFRNNYNLPSINLTGAPMQVRTAPGPSAPSFAPSGAPAVPPSMLPNNQHSVEAGLRNAWMPSSTPNFTMPGYVAPGTGNIVPLGPRSLTTPGRPDISQAPIPTLFDGEGIQALTNELRLGAKEFRGTNSSIMDRRTGKALEDARSAVFNAVDRQALGGDTSALRSLNHDYSNYQAAVRASEMPAAAKRDGVFSPSEGIRAFRQHARDSGSGTAFREGTLPGQDVHNAAFNVLGNNVPDSGTAGRLALATLAVGGGGGWLTSPALSVPALALNGFANTPFGRKYGVGAAYNWQNPLANALRNAQPYVGATGAATANPLLNPNRYQYQEER